MSEQGSAGMLDDDEQVAAYLLRNPEFFQRQPEVVAELRIPHVRGKAVSLVERQLEVLRSKVTQLQSDLDGYVFNGYANDRLLDSTRKLTLALLDVQELSQLVQCVEHVVCTEFEIPFVSFILLSEHGQSAGRVESPQRLRQQVPGVLVEETICGAWREEELTFLFGQTAAARVRSAAIAPLKQGGRTLGLLALGSKMTSDYDSDTGTLFIDYIAELLAHLLGRFMDDV